MKARARRSGFSFIEILFIIGIGTLLLVIIVPVFSAAKKKSRGTACLSNLRQVGLALQLYAQDNDERLPPWVNRRHDEKGESSKWDNPEAFHRAVAYKARDVGIFFCTSDPYAGRDVDVFGVNHRFSSYYYNLKPPQSKDGALTICGLYRGGRLVTPPADYLLIRDANMGRVQYVDGELAYGCEHLRGVNTLYLDWHAIWERTGRR